MSSETATHRMGSSLSPVSVEASTPRGTLPIRMAHGTKLSKGLHRRRRRSFHLDWLPRPHRPRSFQEPGLCAHLRPTAPTRRHTPAAMLYECVGRPLVL